MTEKDKLKEKLLKLGGSKPAPGCMKGCHVIGPDLKIITTHEALHLALEKLIDGSEK